MFRAHKGGKRFPGSANRAGWYVAHILAAKPSGDGDPREWSQFTARKRYLRNLSPLNQFLVPKGNGRDVGERPEVIHTVMELYRSRYGEQFADFMLQAAAENSETGVPNWSQEIEVHSSVCKALKGKKGDSRTAERAARRKVTRRIQPAQDVVSRCSPIGSPSYWSAVFGNGGRNSRIDILEAHPFADERLRTLQRDLSVERVVGMANAYFNGCDPKDLREAASGNVHRQAELAWSALVQGHREPKLGGKWARAVDALRAGENQGVQRLSELKLEPFFMAIWRVVSQVYRKL